ncbi:hypothetical protein K491DRAFT_696015 [Lophiostoma macrostomum CBS 122681]|uniref:DUF7580 domain-containing protein n=1 Tax=Lophiostoma macrostomum CBS 122681 TaxID=1314788 RepID=A0A6A6T090_9PLEO|nr:hypothetical protein K491DRAFT_696015 [Lophiostoma macrostomum CBS 122681]
MSGLEVAGVCLGVLPILLEAIKAYSSVSRSLRVFRHCSSELKSIEKQFLIRRGIFRNECCLLLRLVGDDGAAKDMIDNEADERWKDEQLDARLGAALKDNILLCRIAIEASKDAIDDLQEELHKFDLFVESRIGGESIRSTIRRLRAAARITLDKSKYERILANLRDHNADLTQLRSHFGELQQQRDCTERDSLNRKSPFRGGTIRTASLKLYEALCSAWCCEDADHDGHNAKLCLEAEVEEEVRLDLAISCQQTRRQSPDSFVVEPPIWLTVQSVRINTVDCRADLIRVGSQSIKRGLQDDEDIPFTTIEPSTTPTLPTRRIRLSTVCKKRVRFEKANRDEHAVHFTDDYTDKISAAISETMRHPSMSQINTKDICRYFKQGIHPCTESATRHCLGYLDSPNMYRHVFYFQERVMAQTHRHPRSDRGPLFSISDLLRERDEDSLTIVDQLKLAHRAALAVVQFNSTPWLATNWRLKDIYFGNCNTFDDVALKTLHLTSQLSTVSEKQQPSMEGVEAAGTVFSEEDCYGINNTTIFFLGVALLELAYWKPLEALSVDGDPHEILTARRIAARPTKLGPKYQNITRKCLSCDFGVGNDLAKEELQAAVYGDVVAPLEKMIESLSL